jgi:hypothetical protein
VPTTSQPSIPLRDIVALRALEYARKALAISTYHQDYVRRDVPDPLVDQLCLSFTRLAAAHVGADLAYALFDEVVNTGSDVEECLLTLAGGPRAHVVLIGDGDTLRVDRVCLSPHGPEGANQRVQDLLEVSGEEWARSEEVPLFGSPGPRLDFPAGPLQYDRDDVSWLAGEANRAAHATEGLRFVVKERSATTPPSGQSPGAQPPGGHADVTTWEVRVTNALHAVYPLRSSADAVAQCEAFGALVYRVRLFCELHKDDAKPPTPTAVLQQLDASDLAYAADQAQTPAAFLAAKVAELS